MSSKEKRNYRSYPLTADEVSAITRKELARGASSSSNGLIAAAGRGQVDGSITIGDVIVAIGIVVAFLIIGALVAAIRLLTGASLNSVGRLWEDFVTGGAYLALTRLVIDALDLRRWSGEVIERGVTAWRKVKVVEKETVRLIPFSANHNGPTIDIDTDSTTELPNGREIKIDLLRYFLKKAVSEGSTYWSKEHWCNSPSNKNRPGVELLKGRQWSGIKALCEEYGVWRTDDREKMKVVLEAILEE